MRRFLARARGGTAIFFFLDGTIIGGFIVCSGTGRGR